MCQRYIGQQHREIKKGEIYRVVGASYSIHCAECATEVFGIDWAKDPYAYISRDGYQLSQAERRTA